MDFELGVYPKIRGEISVEDYFEYILPRPPIELETTAREVYSILDQSGIFDNATKTFQSTILLKIFDGVVEAVKRICPGIEPNFRLVLGDHDATVSSIFTGFKASHSSSGFFAISQQLLDDMARRCEELMKKDQWGEASKPPESQRKSSTGSTVYEITAPLVIRTDCSIDDAYGKYDTKSMWNMSRILSLDPSRRFTHGITIEDHSLCLSFLSRGMLLKTRSFDLDEHLQLVRMFLSFAFSSAEDMGWDPTVTFSHADINGRQYHFLVDQHIYRTIEQLCDRSAEDPLGRATRVWKVRDAQGEVHVLKDLWLEIDRQEEHVIYERIVADVERFAPPDTGMKAKKCVVDRMLTPLGHCRVKVCDKVDDTIVVMLRGYDVANIQSVANFSDTSEFSYRERTEFRSDGPKPNPQRYHYRIVFLEYATTLYDERNLANILHAIVGILIAIYHIHAAGWVHRDISGGNLYYYKGRNVGLLGDLEYAKRVDDHSQESAHMGTPAFTSLEVLTSSYCFTMPPDIPGYDELDTDEVSLPDLEVILVPAPPFAHNALHDVEAVWWVLVWVLLFNDDAAVPTQNPVLRQELMNRIFSDQYLSMHRLQFFRTPDFQDCLPASFSPIVKIVSNFSRILYGAYRIAEKDYPTIDSKAEPRFQLQCTRAFNREAMEAASRINLVPTRFRG
ncbi:hypothetical protein F5880DRAFT_1316788 [Lentinula raphanica]|nr:hypothetical protein F5880DRAFT_1316788 [Lentinula raphanica]